MESIPENATPCFPLEHEWTMYLHYPVYGEKYTTKAYQEVGSFQTVEDFWKYLDVMPFPSSVFMDSHGKRGKVDAKILEAFGLFKAGIHPEWEDPQNQTGGHWECRRPFPPHVLDQLWYDVVLALVGETLEDGHEITGARIVDKSRYRKAEYRLEVWTRTLDQDKNEEIRQKMQAICPPNTHFVWKQHSEAITAWKVSDNN